MLEFSLYSELQCNENQTPQQVYTEAFEQIENADRHGFFAYSVIEHAWFQRFGVSPAPLAFLAAAAQRTQRIHLRTLVHTLPLWNPGLLASQIAEMDYLTGGRYEFGLGRGHAWIFEKAGVPIEESRPRYEEGLEIVLGMLDNPDGFSFDGHFWTFENAKLVPPPITKRFNIIGGGTSDRTYELAGERGWMIAAPTLLPLGPMQHQLDVYRAACDRAGHVPRVMWGHIIYMDEDFDTATREAERALEMSFRNNASPVPELPNKDKLEAAGYHFYASPVLNELGSKSFDQLIEDDLIWVGTPERITERIMEAQREVPDMVEFQMPMNPGGLEHWKVIKTQELFAREVMPHFQGIRAGAPAGEALVP